MTKFSVFAITMVTASGISFAQTAPNIGDALRQTSPPKTQNKTTLDLPFGKTLSPLNIPGNKNEETIEVKKFAFTGNDSIATNDLRPLLSSLEGRNLSLTQLQFAADLITQHYRSQGYFIARAILPPQDIVDGVVTIELVEGKAGKISGTNTSLVNNQTVDNILNDIEKGKAISFYSLERALLTINNLPGATLTGADIAAGQRPGTSDLNVRVDKRNRINGFLMADNFGSSYTGRNRVLAGVDVNSPLGMGDKLSFGGQITQGQYLKNFRVSYGALLHSSGLRGEIAAARTSYELTSDFDSLDAVGTAKTYEASLSYPLVLTQRLIVSSGLNFAHKDLEDNIRSTDTSVPKSINSISPGVEFDFDNDLFGFEGRSNIGTSLTVGHLDIKDSESADLDKAGADTQGTFVKSNFYAGHQMAFDQNWDFSVSIKGQQAYGKNLDGSEDMTISGVNGVKAYPPDEFAAENAYFAQAELLYTIPSGLPFMLRVGPFVEGGYAHVQNKTDDNDTRTLSNVGISAYVNYGDLFLNLKLARATGSDARSDDVSDTRGFFQMGIRF